MKALKTITLILFTTLFITQAFVLGETKETKETTQSKTPEFKDILGLKSPSSPLISPNGEYILYSVRQPDWEKNTYVSQIWMILVKTGELKQMTFAKDGSFSFDWSPDSRYITFKSKRGEKTQLYMMSVSGGEGKQITDFKSGFGGYEWSPEGKRIAYTAKDEKAKREKAIEKKYGGFKVIDHDSKPSHLRLLDVDTGKTEKLVDRTDLHITSFSWSPDGKQIAFSGRPDSRTHSFSKSDIYIVNVADKKVTRLVNQKGPDSSPTWSPDGKIIAFVSGMGTDSYFTNQEICTIPANGGSVTCLTKKFDENPGLQEWKKEGIYFSAFQGMTRHLFLLSPKTNRITSITKGYQWVLSGGSMDKAGKTVAFSYTNADSYPEVYHSRLKPFKPRKLTDFSDQIKDWTLSTKEAISWKSTDGAEITGVLIKPADFDPKKKYPLFVIIHGGPTGISIPRKIDRMNRYYPIEQWAAKGGVILEPNYRGSAGFGAEFRKLNYRNMGPGDYWDVISGVDYLIGKGFIDKDRVASMGWSQGGYISAFITTFSDRFNSVSVGAGISDWVTYYYRTDITPFTVHYLGATPWDDPDIYKKTSPMTHINNAKTPTLIQHGEFDRRVPTPNAYKLYRGLQDKGVPSKLIIYKGFGHGISKPKENLAVLTHNWEWFNQYIYGEEPKEEKFEEEEDKKKDKKN
ncbi:MAG: S9 family peptidase [bacterium]|nr:S9 family peptidase [bacterium]